MSTSSSAIVVGTVSARHLLKIDAYSRSRDLLACGTCATSLDFPVGDYTAHIRYYPNGTGYPNGSGKTNSSSCTSFILRLDLGDCIVVHRKVQVEISVLDQAGKVVPGGTYTDSKSTNVDPMFTANFSKGANWDDWVRQNGDCFTVRCDVTFIEAPSATALVAVDPNVVVPPSDLQSHLGCLLLSEEGADVTFQLGADSFAAHRCVLAARSSVFKAELFGSMKEGTATEGGAVRVVGVEAQAFKAFLHFVYTDELPLPDISEEEEETWMAQHLLVLADRYNMERLKLICDGKLRKRLDVGSAATTLALAEQHHCPALKEACLDFLDLPGNLKAVEASDGFEHLATSCPGVLREIIAKLGAL